MKTLSPQTIIFSSRYLSIYHGLRISPFSTSPPPPPSSFPSRRHEEESRCVRVSVWWDFENCQLPAGANVFKVGQRITAAIRANGIRGPVQITAFGDMLQLSRANQEALSATGINLTHIPHGGKNSADRSLLVDLMYWVSQNPPPAHLFLISGDRDFAGILHRLRMNNYNILLSSPETAPCVLCSAASIMWHWSALLKGENLTGKYFNQPPDGPYGSWYGHYRVFLEDPFAVAEQPAFSRPEEVSELNSDLKVRPVPKAVVKQIRHILKSYPKGVSISELSSELRKSIVGIDKDLYGYKKFSRFLLSMPHILKIDFGNDGHLFVNGIAPKVPEPVGSSPGDIANTEAPPIAISSTKGMEENPMLPLNPELNVKKPPRKSVESQMKIPLVEKVNNTDETGNHLHLSDLNNSKSEVGFFERMRRKWFGGEDVDCENTERSSGEISEKPQPEEMGLKSKCQSTDPVGPASFSSSEEAVMDDKLVGGGKSKDQLSSRDPGFFKKIISWCKFWGNRSNSEISIEQSSENVNQVAIDSGRHEVFVKESFWKEMEEFIDTPPNGSVLVLQSKSREQMAENLQKQGPSSLKSFTQSDLLHLVDLLISEKRWVEECSSQTYPFRLNRSSRNSATSSDTPNSNGLRSLFLNTTSQSRQQRTPSPPLNNKKQSLKSRNEILADCQKLVDDLLEENPEGFNMGSFRNQFLDRYGYHLDIQKLGYQKLATLLQIMPGVKIESTYVLPGNFAKSSCPETPLQGVLENHVANSDGEISDTSNDSPWAELGPVSKTGPAQKAGSKSERVNRAYEMLSDDCVSDSDEENSLVGSEGKCKIDDEDSSLLRILDSWYGVQEEGNKKEERESVDAMVVDALEQSDSSGVGSKTENLEVNCVRKQRNFKSYSFVSEQDGDDDNKDRLIDGILTSLKKSGESKMQA